MSEVHYDSQKIEEAITNSTTVSSNVVTIVNDISDFLEKLDKRIRVKYASTMSSIRKIKRNLEESIEEADNFTSWLTQTYQNYNDTVKKVNDISSSPNLTDIDSSIDGTEHGIGDASLGGIAAIGAGIDSAIGGQGSADSREEFRLDPEKWAELPATTKDAVEAKLKELGFTDDEIKKIKNGETGVDKVVLDSLSAQLEQALKNNPSIRQLLIDKYGFDIFNDDGTVNKDLLSIAMMIDGKNPNDQYDLQSFLSSLKEAKLEETSGPSTTISGTGTPINQTEITQIHDNNNVPGRNQQNVSSTTTHSGAGYSGADANGSTSTDSATTSLLDAMTGADGEDSIDDVLSNTTTSLTGGKFKPTGNIPDIKKGGMGVGTAVAGIGAAAGTAGIGGVLVKKKKDKDEKNEDNEFDFEDDEFLEQKTEEDSQNTKTESSDDKEWLYGLGIGLAPAGTTAKITKDKLDKNEEEK